MSLEDQVHFHEQWLRSIDSNFDRASAHLAEADARLKATDARLEATNAALAIVAQNQSNFAAAMVTLTNRMDGLAANMALLTTRMDALAVRMDTIAEQHRRLEEAFEQYLRFRANGGPKN